MASITRAELKDIVKECILEVLLEGLRPNDEESPRSQRESVNRPTSSAKKHLDSIAFSTGASKVAEQAQGRRDPIPAVKNLAAEFPKGERGIMQQIFEDTARNTLPAQLTAERNPAAAAAMSRGNDDVDPMEAFGGSSNWADLAFSSAKKS
jgi:hypothetical protein